MNKVRLKKVAKALREETLAKRKVNPVGFNMNGYIVTKNSWNIFPDTGSHKCGTTACIAGQTKLLFPEEAKKIKKDYYLTAKRILDLSWNQADSLFNYTHSWVTPQHAARVIENLIKTGEVNW